MTGQLSGVPRLYVAAALSAHAEATLSRAQSHYLAHVLRLRAGSTVRVFNATDGEWLAYIVAAKKAVTIRCERHLAAAKPPLAVLVGSLFLPLAHAPNYKLAISCDRPVTRRPRCGSAPSAGSRWGASSGPGSRAAARAATAARNVSGCNTLKILETIFRRARIPRRAIKRQENHE